MSDVTRVEFAKAFLKGISAPDSKRNLWALVSWMQAEGNAGKFNPLNTTLKMSGSTNFNVLGYDSQGKPWGVQNYTSFKQGVEATAKTLLDGAKKSGDPYGYVAILQGFRDEDLAMEILEGVESSNWGTGGLALQCLYWVKRYWANYKDKLIAQ